MSGRIIIITLKIQVDEIQDPGRRGENDWGGSGQGGSAMSVM